MGIKLANDCRGHRSNCINVNNICYIFRLKNGFIVYGGVVANGLSGKGCFDEIKKKIIIIILKMLSIQ